AHVDLVRGGAPLGTCSGLHHTAKSRGRFGLVVWGTDQCSSYAYQAGGNLTTLNDVPVNPPVPKETCFARRRSLRLPDRVPSRDWQRCWTSSTRTTCGRAPSTRVRQRSCLERCGVIERTRAGSSSSSHRRLAAWCAACSARATSTSTT